MDQVLSKNFCGSAILSSLRLGDVHSNQPANQDSYIELADDGLQEREGAGRV